MINNDSILFLLAARETLCLIADSSNMSKDNKNVLTDFMINEASDYQVMSLLLDGKLPESEINEAEEEELFKKLRVIVAANKKLVCEMFGVDVYNDVVKKIEPLYPNLSTTKPVLNFYLGSGGLNALLEAPFSELSGAGSLALKRGRGRLLNRRLQNVSPAEAQKQIARLKKLGAIPPDFKVTPFKPIKKVLKTTRDPLAALPPGYRKVGKKVVKTVSKAKTHFDKPIADIKRKAVEVKPVVQDVKKKGIEAGIKAGTKIKDVAATAGKAVSKAGKAVAGFAKTSPGIVGGAAIAALALYASYKVYKRFLSKAAKACGGRSGAEKTSCMKKFQISAYNAQIKDLQAASGGCSKSKNPGKCKMSIAKKIYKIKQKMTKAT